jgi:hypothetical protein
MAEDDTFDIDIYGDDAQDQAQQNNQDGDDLIFDDDELDNPQPVTDKPSNANSTPQQPPTAPQGTKRKAQEYEEEPGQAQQISMPSQPNSLPNSATEPGAMPALRLAELHWWTTEEDVRAFCARAGVEGELREITFGEHKINGKSRGEAYLEFASPRAASATKAEIERVKNNEGAKKDGSTPTPAQRANPFTVTYCAVNNPFKGRDGGAAGKKDYNNSGAYNSSNTNNARGGYNNNFQNRGGYNNTRGGGFQNNRGGFQNNRGGFQNHTNHTNAGINPQVAAGGVGAWGGMNPMTAMNGFNPAMNPMMGMMNNMAAAQQMGGFANMMAAQQRGGAAGMMGRGAGMMGRGGMGMGGMMNAGAGAGRGGWGAFGGAAGFNPAMMQQGGQQQGQQQQQQGAFGMQQGQNKRMKSE